jgi:hypothetical protein
VVPGHHDDAVPAVAGQQHQVREQLARAGGDGEVDAVGRHQFGDLLGRALLQLQVDPRVALAELPDDVRQHVARLGVGGGQRQRPLLLPGHVAGEAADVLHFAHDPAGAADHFPAGRGDGRQALALAGEELHAKLLLQQLELLADSRLARIQAVSGGRDVEATVGNGHQVPELLESHGWKPGLPGAGTAVAIWPSGQRACQRGWRPAGLYRRAITAE